MYNHSDDDDVKHKSNVATDIAILFLLNHTLTPHRSTTRITISHIHTTRITGNLETDFLNVFFFSMCIKLLRYVTTCFLASPICTQSHGRGACCGYDYCNMANGQYDDVWPIIQCAKSRKESQNAMSGEVSSRRKVRR